MVILDTLTKEAADSISRAEFNTKKLCSGEGVVQWLHLMDFLSGTRSIGFSIDGIWFVQGYSGLSPVSGNCGRIRDLLPLLEENQQNVRMQLEQSLSILDFGRIELIDQFVIHLLHGAFEQDSVGWIKLALGWSLELPDSDIVTLAHAIRDCSKNVRIPQKLRQQSLKKMRMGLVNNKMVVPPDSGTKGEL